jgi:hypothetical protein
MALFRQLTSFRRWPQYGAEWKSDPDVCTTKNVNNRR